jgi:hypothetical protein
MSNCATDFTIEGWGRADEGPEDEGPEMSWQSA